MTCIFLLSKIVLYPLTLKLRIQTTPNLIALNLRNEPIILQVNPVGFVQLDTDLLDNVHNFVIFSHQCGSQSNLALSFYIFFNALLSNVSWDVLHFVT